MARRRFNDSGRRKLQSAVPASVNDLKKRFSKTISERTWHDTFGVGIGAKSMHALIEEINDATIELHGQQFTFRISYETDTEDVPDSSSRKPNGKRAEEACSRAVSSQGRCPTPTIRSSDSDADLRSECPLLRVYSNVPKPKPYFTGRDDELEALHNELKQSNAAVVAQAIRGLGGIGKSELVKRFAERYKHEYHARFWVVAETQMHLDKSFAFILDIIYPDNQVRSQGKTELDAARNLVSIRRDVITWLEQNPAWLLIFDNVTNPELIRDYLPESGGHVLVTSQANEFRCLGVTEPIKLKRWPLKTAVNFLLQSVGRDAFSDKERKAAADIAELIDGLPLTLDEAAKFLAVTPDLTGYAHHLRTERIAEWFNKKTDPGYEKSTATVWQISFNHLRTHNPASAELLQFCSFLGPEAIPYELLIDAGDHLGPHLSKSLKGAEYNPIKLQNLLAPLDRFSLIDIDKENRTFNIHRVVQATTRDSMDDATRREWVQRAILAIEFGFVIPSHQSRAVFRRLALHALVVIDHSMTIHSKEFRATGRFYGWVAQYLVDNRMLSEARRVYGYALTADRSAHGEDSVRYGTTLGRLATVNAVMGRYSEAENGLKQSLEILRATDTSRYIASAIRQLSLVCVLTGQHEKAEIGLKEVVEMKRSTFDETGPEMMEAISDLAVAYLASGRYGDVESCLIKSIESQPCRSGTSRSRFPESLDYLAFMLYGAKRVADAKELLEQGLRILIGLFGECHPDTIDVQQSFNEMMAELGDQLG